MKNTVRVQVNWRSYREEDRGTIYPGVMVDIPMEKPIKGHIKETIADVALFCNKFSEQNNGRIYNIALNEHAKGVDLPVISDENYLGMNNEVKQHHKYNSLSASVDRETRSNERQSESLKEEIKKQLEHIDQLHKEQHERDRRYLGLGYLVERTVNYRSYTKRQDEIMKTIDKVNDLHLQDREIKAKDSENEVIASVFRNPSFDKIRKNVVDLVHSLSNSNERTSAERETMPVELDLSNVGKKVEKEKGALGMA